MSNGEKFTVETLTYLHTWTPSLFTLRLTRPADFRFVPGQFARLGMELPDPASGEISTLWRPYSIASAERDDFLEFYSIVAPGGPFSTKLVTMKVGDTLKVDKTAFGFLTTERFVDGQDLWMLATGTGLAPFLAILEEPATWAQYQRVILVHSVRQPDELAYQERIRTLTAPYAGRFQYVPTCTRAALPGALSKRITTLLQEGDLERHVGLQIDQERSRLMICGNPEMVDETRKLLGERGLTPARRATPGQYVVENGW